MKVLIACEFSGIVRDAFKAKGHNAWSCDLLPTEKKGNHMICDVLETLNEGWDLMIAHPPCTYLSVSGMHWTTRGLRDPQLTEDALNFVKALMDAPIRKICIENPISIISSRIRKPDQIIQPWWFGEDASKKTCLWLKGLPLLKPENIIPPKGWQIVKHAIEMIECPDCGEPYCETHNLHYSDCDCIGPTEDEATYKEIDGALFANRDEIKKPLWGNQTPQRVPAGRGR